MIRRQVQWAQCKRLVLGHMAVFSISSALTFYYAAASRPSPSETPPTADPAPPPTSYWSVPINVATSVLGWLRTNRGRLFSTEILVTCTVVALGSTALMGMLGQRKWNRRIGIKIFRYAIFSISSVLASYAISYVKSTPFRNDLFVVCAVYVMLVLGSIESVSPVRVDINLLKGSQLRELSQIISIFTIVFSEKVTTIGFRVALLLLTATGVCKFVRRFLIYYYAQETRTLDESGSLIAEATIAQNRYNNENEKNKLLVVGEISDQKFLKLDTVWECKGELLEDERGKRIKDLCLSFALFKLLKSLLGGQDLSQKEFGMNPNFVLGNLLGHGKKGTDYVHEDAFKNEEMTYDSEEAEDKNTERAFWIVQLELGFLYNQFYTRYPLALSHMGIKACTITSLLLLYAGQVTLFCTLIIYKVPKDHVNHISDGVNVDSLVTMGTATIVLVVVTIDLIFPMFSKWNAINTVCDCVKRTEQDKKKLLTGLRNLLVKIACKIPSRGHDKIFQYSLVEDFGKKAFWSKVSFKLLDESRDGQNITRIVELSMPVKRAVAAYLRQHLRGGQRLKLEEGRKTIEGYQNHLLEPLLLMDKNIKIKSYLTASSDRENEMKKTLKLIFLWHIATTFLACRSQALENIDKWFDFKSSKEGFRQDAVVATTLSGYCAYLVACARDLLPEDRVFTEKYFDQTVYRASRIFGECKSTMKSKYEKMLNSADLYHEMAGETKDIAYGLWIGNNLPLELMTWKSLAGFWTAMVMFLAMSSKPDSHIGRLPVGAELLTQIWVLISHSGGIDSSNKSPTPN